MVKHFTQQKYCCCVGVLKLFLYLFVGYLGINGAGKTTTLKMLTGEVIPTAGNAFLNGLDISNSQVELRRLIGYCPQFDALIESLTAREHLLLFARIKGVKESEVHGYVNTLIQKLGLQSGIEDKPCGGYSGTTKKYYN